MTTTRIALIPGDGIGKEVVPEGARALEAAARRFGLDLACEELDWSCAHFERHGRMMPEDGLDRLAGFDAIYLGAVGWPSVPDHVSLWGLLIPIRRRFEQYVNLRPVRLFEGVPCPLAGKRAGEIDMLIVRENCEGEYSEIGGRLYAGTSQEMAVQESVFTRHGVDRVLRYAFDAGASSTAAAAHLGHQVQRHHPHHAVLGRAGEGDRGRVPATSPTAQYHIDILAAHFVGRPERFDVVVASNLFGDILSDLGPAVTGTIGIAPSANLNPERAHPSMFEPVHGSAPDIAGQGIANPIGQIWSGAMLLDHLGHTEAAAAILGAIERVLASGRDRTPDMGGRASTNILGRTIAGDI